MGKRIRLLALTVTASAAFCASASGDIVAQQLPAQAGGPASDTLFRNELDQVVWQQEADNIVLSASVTLSRISWWGFYGGGDTQATPPPPTETMRIRFYGARASDGLPDDGNILLEEHHTDAVRTATGLIVLVGGNPAEYYYQADLATPLLLNAATLYWLEIVQIGDMSSVFRWESGGAGGFLLPGHSVKHTFLPNWQMSQGSFAFELSTVPEPSSALFFLFVVNLLTGHRVRSGRRCVDSSSQDYWEWPPIPRRAIAMIYCAKG